jgi:hypothetical protein
MARQRQAHASTGWRLLPALPAVPSRSTLSLRTSASAVLVEQADRVLGAVAGEVAVVADDHGQGRARAAGEVEGEDAGTEREGGEGVSETVDPARWPDPGRDP